MLLIVETKRNNYNYLLLLLRANQRHERVHVFIRPAARQEPASTNFVHLPSVG